MAADAARPCAVRPAKALAPLERRLDYYGWLGSTPGNAKEVRVYGLGNVFLERVREARRTLFDRKLRLQRKRIFSDVLTQGFAAVRWPPRSAR